MKWYISLVYVTLVGKSAPSDHLVPQSIDQFILLIIRTIEWSFSCGKWWSISAKNAAGGISFLFFRQTRFQSIKSRF
jgi:hypothetical protein